MSHIGIKHEQHHPDESTFYYDTAPPWSDSPVAHHHSPVQEHNAFAFNPPPMEPIFSQHQAMQPPRPTHQHLQPLIMPQWPSMLTAQTSYAPHQVYSAPAPAPVQATPAPVSATSTRTSSTPRKTLTDNDRRRMCLYHEEHPTVKQTEIGAMFGVERSTVSKVLRQKEKYLYQDDGSRSPIKRSKSKFPDVERALANWAKNHQRQGLPLTDDMIKEKAQFFAASVGSSESHIQANTNTWLAKFKQKNSLMGAKSRKRSIADDSEPSNPPSSAHTPNEMSPCSPRGISSPSPLTSSSLKSEEILVKTESPDSYRDQPNRPFPHSQSNTSLSSVFTDAAGSTFSAGPTSPTSPFFTPDSVCGPSPFMPSQQPRSVTQRSQSFPALGIDPYGSPPSSSEAETPRYVTSTTLESPIADPSMGGVEEMMQHQQQQQQQPSTLLQPQTTSMQPPPLPALTPVTSTQQISPVSPGSNNGTGGPSSSPSQEDARKALELVMSFFQHQPSGFVEPQEYVTIGKLMEKLRLQQQQRNNGSSMVVVGGENLPGGLHRIPEQELVRKT
ncbi:hypothetical protein IWX90DRAFT_74034 [Phyllosticta citrichinensis]|uniref:HTH CENPB-type domain-containing protein n=1 Tax=Phyllosticta citrichinensis TaxID=1130410 RepID=A0ABR1XGG4_9PEZI